MSHFPRVLALTAALSPALALSATAQTAIDRSEQAVFRSSIDLVSLAAVVRDSRGRVISTLRQDDFELYDAGRPRPILDMRTEAAAPASVALLVDGSGSMRVGASLAASKHISHAILKTLNPTRDDAALFSFDTRLIAVQDFTRDIKAVQAHVEQVEAWGSTSLYDAIAGAAGIVSKRTTNRRAVVVLTDGTDTTSSYSPSEVSAIASAVDVPVYVFALARPPHADRDGELAAGTPLADLARWTGGDYLDASTPLAITKAIGRLVEDLRHQYLIAFEASSTNGWRAVELKTRKKGFTVRTRGWYLSGAGE
jgi:Ca-activated chloride channel family protein